MAEVTARTPRQILEGASLALGRIDRDGIRGLTCLSVEATGDMACALIMFGLVATPPGETPPEHLFPNQEEVV